MYVLRLTAAIMCELVVRSRRAFILMAISALLVMASWEIAGPVVRAMGHL